MLISIGYRCMLSHVNVLLFSEYVLCNCKIVAIFDDPSLPFNLLPFLAYKQHRCCTQKNLCDAAVEGKAVLIKGRTEKILVATGEEEQRRKT